MALYAQEGYYTCMCVELYTVHTIDQPHTRDCDLPGAIHLGGPAGPLGVAGGRSLQTATRPLAAQPGGGAVAGHTGRPSPAPRVRSGSLWSPWAPWALWPIHSQALWPGLQFMSLRLSATLCLHHSLVLGLGLGLRLHLGLPFSSRSQEYALSSDCRGRAAAALLAPVPWCQAGPKGHAAHLQAAGRGRIDHCRWRRHVCVCGESVWSACSDSGVRWVVTFSHKPTVWCGSGRFGPLFEVSDLCVLGGVSEVDC